MIIESEVEPRSLRDVIERFICERLRSKLEKLKPDEAENRSKLEESHTTAAWLADAARRVTQIKLATHILKPIHPDARGTNLRARPPVPARAGLVGSFSVPATLLEDDVVGNAAALDVFKFLRLEWGGKTLLTRVLENDAEILCALSQDSAEAEKLVSAFASIASRDDTIASHSLGKQCYFPLSNGQGYHLLAPLFPTSLAHLLHARITNDRFGDAAKAARDAHSKNQHFAHGYREYPNLAIRKFGGTKPQNISQLNSERAGENRLMPNLPPNWEDGLPSPPVRCESVFGTRFGRSKRVRSLTRELREFLETETRNNLATRRRRAWLVEAICTEAHEYAASISMIEPGWSSAAACELHGAEQHWLDPHRAAMDEEFAAEHQLDWATTVSHRFANWLNQELRTEKLSMSEDEHRQWTSDFGVRLGGFQSELEEQRA